MDPTVEAKAPRCRRCGAAMNAGAADELCACCIFSAALTTMGEDHLAAEAAGMVLGPQHFPGYELLGEIARGGMGVVFRARQLRPDRLVALKVIAAGELASPRMVERFRTEAETAARLDHPNIVPIHEVGHQRGWHFFSMRLIEGRTLGQAIGAPQSLRHEREPGQERRSPCGSKEEKTINEPQGLRRSDPRWAAALMVKIARAVQHAHERGVLHRDLKPNNILLDASGEPHLTDFGLAKMLERSVEMTQSNMVLGTPAYMAPEQAAGGTRDVTVSVDVYGLGAVLYEMLAGRPPFEAPTTHALLRMLAEEEPVPPSRRKVISRSVNSESVKARGGAAVKLNTDSLITDHSGFASDLDAICLKCLEKEPAHRYATAGQLADDLERALRGEPILAQPSTATQRVRKWVRRNPAKGGLIATAVLSLVVIVLGSVLFSVRVNRARAEAQRQLVSKHLNDAARLAAEGDGFRGAISLSQALSQTDPDDPSRPRMGGRLNATFQLSPRLLRLRDVKGIPARLEFSGSSQELSITIRDGPTLNWNLRANQIVTQAVRIPPLPLRAVLSPDGAWQLKPVRGSTTVELASARGGTNIAAYPLAGPAYALAFSPDSASFAIAAFGEQVTTHEAATGRPRRSWIAHESGANQARFSPDGRLLVTAGFDYQLRIHSAAREQLVAPIIRHASLIESVAFSPDGRFLAAGNLDGVVQVWDLDTSARLLLLEGEVRPRVALTPDGKFAVLAGDDNALHVCDVLTGRETGAPMPVPDTLGLVFFDVSGQRLAVSCRKSGLRIFDFQSRRLVTEIKNADAATADIATGAFSPDGTQLVTSTPDGLLQRWSVADGRPLGPEMNRSEETYLIHWSRDGRWISTGGGTSVQLWDAATGRLVGDPVRLKKGERVTDCKFSPDGRRILIAFSNEAVEPAAAQLHEVPSLKPIGAPMRHGDGIRGGLFSPDGKLVATAGEDNVARLWRADDGSPASPPLRHQGLVFGLAFCGDGRVLATGNVDGRLRLWDAERGELFAPPMQFGGLVDGLRFSTDGASLVLNTPKNQTWVIPCAEQRASLEALQRLAECQSGLHVDAAGQVTALSAAELERRFAALSAGGPSWLAWPDDLQRWHVERAAVAERQNEWFTAVFHLERLAALDGAKSSFQKRLAHARKQLP